MRTLSFAVLAAVTLAPLPSQASADGAPVPAGAGRAGPAAAAAAAATSTPPPALSFGLLQSLPMQQRAEDEAGVWVELAVTLGQQIIGPYLRYTVAGRDAEGVWIELWISQRPGSGTQAFQLLLSDDGAGPSKILRARQRVLGGKVVDLELPAEAPEDEREGRLLPRTKERDEPILTNAGTFQARRVDLFDARGGDLVASFWRADEVPIFGVARFGFAEGLGMELHAFGAGGSSLFPPLAASSPD